MFVKKSYHFDVIYSYNAYMYTVYNKKGPVGGKWLNKLTTIAYIIF